MDGETLRRIKKEMYTSTDKTSTTEPRRKCAHGRRNTKENQGVNIVTQGQRKANESIKGKHVHIVREKPMKFFFFFFFFYTCTEKHQ